MYFSAEFMVQIKQLGGIGVETPPPESFLGGSTYTHSIPACTHRLYSVIASDAVYVMSSA